MKKIKNINPKNPLLSIMFSCFFSGFGQIYAGRIKRGILFFLLKSTVPIVLLLVVFHPEVKLNNFAFILFGLFYLFEIFVIFDSFQCAKNFNVKNNLIFKRNILKDIFIIFGICLFVFGPSLETLSAIYIKKNIVQTFKIPTETMFPTLQKNDRIVVDKKIYKKEEMNRGDVITFKYPKDAKRNFIKRIIGLPGEILEIRDGQILINSHVLSEPNIFYYNGGEYGRVGQKIQIPEGSYFVLGDNSISSNDSRYWGFVPKENIIGKAYKIYYPFERSGIIN